LRLHQKSLQIGSGAVGNGPTGPAHCFGIVQMQMDQSLFGFMLQGGPHPLDDHRKAELLGGAHSVFGLLGGAFFHNRNIVLTQQLLGLMFIERTDCI